MVVKEKVTVRKGSKLWQEEVVEDLSLCLPRLVLQGTEEDIVVEAALKSKSLYKVELYLLKIMPMIIALAYLVNTVSSYLGIDLPILASIAGMSLIPLIFMYISSYVFRFCEYHRMFLHYVAVNDIINIYDWYIGIDISDRDLLVLNMSVAGISLFIILYLYVKNHKKSVTKGSR